MISTMVEVVCIVGVLVSSLAVASGFLIVVTMPYRLRPLRGQYKDGASLRELTAPVPGSAFLRLDLAFLWVGLNHAKLWRVVKWTAPATPATMLLLALYQRL